jgi:hypothetical protein
MVAMRHGYAAADIRREPSKVADRREAGIADGGRERLSDAVRAPGRRRLGKDRSPGQSEHCIAGAK